MVLRDASKRVGNILTLDFASFAARTSGAQARYARTLRELVDGDSDTASREEREAAKNDGSMGPGFEMTSGPRCVTFRKERSLSTVRCKGKRWFDFRDTPSKL